MKSNNTNCVKCGKPLLFNDGKKIKIRTNIIVFEKAIDENDFTNSTATIKCGNCHADNFVPIRLDLDNNNKFKHFILEK